MQTFTRCTPSPPQRVERRFTRSAGPASGIRYLSKLSTSRLQPSEHVGKQLAGGAGCRAWEGSGGIAGGATTAGGDGCDALAQPSTSSSGASGISTRQGGEFVGMVGDLLHCRDAAGFLGSGGFLGLEGSGHERGAVGIPAGLHPGGPGLDAADVARDEGAGHERQASGPAQHPQRRDGHLPAGVKST